MRRIFGPVPSRRLGRSLGIDVIPYKTCTFDCVYCECGETTDKSCNRRDFFPPAEILDELEERLSNLREKPDYLTLSGAGEPTLYNSIGELIHKAKRTSNIPVAVITNSSLLCNAEVREELYLADIVLPSLDTAVEETFQRLNRPHEDCNLKEIMNGLEIFTKKFRGMVSFEILLVDGYNTDENNLLSLKAALERFRIDAIQLNTAVRPGTVGEIEPVSGEELERIKSFFGPGCEIIADFTAKTTHEVQLAEETIVSLLKRRPCTSVDIHSSLGIPLPAVIKILTSLTEQGSVTSESHGDKTFYTAANRNRDA